MGIELTTLTITGLGDQCLCDSACLSCLSSLRLSDPYKVILDPFFSEFKFRSRSNFPTLEVDLIFLSLDLNASIICPSLDPDLFFFQV